MAAMLISGFPKAKFTYEDALNRKPLFLCVLSDGDCGFQSSVAKAPIVVRILFVDLL